MAPAWRRHQAASLARSAFPAGAGQSAEARSKRAAAFLSSAAERGLISQVQTNQVRATVLRGGDSAWEAGPRSAAELKKAAAYFERAAALCSAPALKSALAEDAADCRGLAEAMSE